MFLTVHTLNLSGRVAAMCRCVCIRRSRCCLNKLRDMSQAIYSMHRGNLDGARGQLEKAKAIATAIYDERVKGASTLRYGSFSNALEE